MSEPFATVPVTVPASGIAGFQRPAHRTVVPATTLARIPPLSNRTHCDDSYFLQMLELEPMLRRVLCRYAEKQHDVSDLLQDVYLKLLCWTRSKPVAVRNVKAFAAQTAHNVALDWLRRLQSAFVEFTPEPESLESVDVDTDAARLANCEQELDELARIISTLPKQRRRVFTLRKVYGFSQKEIAEQLQISENTVEQHVTKAARLVAKCTTDLSLRLYSRAFEQQPKAIVSA